MIDIKDLIGVPYCTHGRSKIGMDCYGVIIEVLRRAGIIFPDIFYMSTSCKENQKTIQCVRKLMLEGLPVDEVAIPEYLCIIEFKIGGKSSSHAGIYLGEGKFIHATRDCGVCIQDLERYKNIITHCWRIRTDGKGKCI